MKNINNLNKLITLAILIVTFVLANINFQKNKSANILINSEFPSQIGKWNGKDVQINESTFDIIDRDELMMRKYINADNKDFATVSIVVSENRDHIHNPSICYVGQGIAITNPSVINLGKDKVNYFDGYKNKEKYIVIYWFSDLERTYHSNSDFSMSVRTRKFWNKPVKGMALVVITSKSKNKEDLLNFANSINKKLLSLK